MRSARLCFLLIASMAGFLGAQSGAKRAIRIGDMYRLQQRRRPADSRPTASGLRTSSAARIRPRTNEHRCLDGELGRHAGHSVTSSPNAETRRAGVRTASISLSCRHAMAARGRNSGCSTAGRRSEARHRAQGRHREYAWSPDSKRIALMMSDVARTMPTRRTRSRSPSSSTDTTSRDDDSGYLDSTHTHLYVFDIARQEGDADHPGHVTRRAIPHGRRTASGSRSKARGPGSRPRQDEQLRRLRRRGPRRRGA